VLNLQLQKSGARSKVGGGLKLTISFSTFSFYFSYSHIVVELLATSWFKRSVRTDKDAAVIGRGVGRSRKDKH
jgi:hypothetical protein